MSAVYLIFAGLILIICPYHDAQDVPQKCPVLNCRPGCHLDNLHKPCPICACEDQQVNDEVCKEEYPNCLSTGGSCLQSEDGIVCACQDDTMLTKSYEKCIKDEDCNRVYVDCLSTGGTCVLKKKEIICKCPEDKIFTDRNKTCGTDYCQTTKKCRENCLKLNNTIFTCSCREWYEDIDGKCQIDSYLCLRNQFKCPFPRRKCIGSEVHCDQDYQGLDTCGDDDSHHLHACNDNHCLEGEHRCGNGRCIPAAWVCDGRTQCFDRSDEIGCTPVTDALCLRNQFRCSNGDCIPIILRCDLWSDCYDSSDEQECPKNWCPEGYLPCSDDIPDTRSCVRKSSFCNGLHDECPGDTDEKDCKKCENWGCEQNCNDTEDGPQCYCNEGYRQPIYDKRTCIKEGKPLQCLRNQFPCESGERCIPIRFRCGDSKKIIERCHDRSHQAGCNTTNQCSEGEHRCGISSKCIPASRICDGHYDCGDNSDEKDCVPIKDPVCLRNQFRCTSGKCIPMYRRCDGFASGADCLDYSDELECPKDWCPEGYLPCDKAWDEDGKRNCIQKSRFCDGLPDCRDKSDEKDCDQCKNWGCSQFCKETLPWPLCFCEEGYKLDDRDKRTCILIETE